MTAPQKFRSAINGFNREDVVRFIEYSNSRHEAEATQLREELASLRAELNDRQPVEDSRVEALVQKCAELQRENAALHQENAALRQQQQTVVVEKTPPAPTDDELAAYRRAERAERVAKGRVSQMYIRANAALADTAANLDGAAADLGKVAAVAMDQLRVLQTAVYDSKQVLADAAVTLGSIRPESDEE